jgi:DNA-binding response OmpR family regulator
MHRILIVVDERHHRENPPKYTERWGFAAACVRDFSDVAGRICRLRAAAGAAGYRLAVFQRLPLGAAGSGRIQGPIIFLSSASENMNNRHGHEHGRRLRRQAFDLHVLIAKIQALLRRTYDFSVSSNLQNAAARSSTPRTPPDL